MVEFSESDKSEKHMFCDIRHLSDDTQLHSECVYKCVYFI